MKTVVPSGTPMDRVEGGIPSLVAEHLKKLKNQAKIEGDKMYQQQRMARENAVKVFSPLFSFSFTFF